MQMEMTCRSFNEAMSSSWPAEATVAPEASAVLP
jgi:hypothetical protein